MFVTPTSIITPSLRVLLGDRWELQGCDHQTSIANNIHYAKCTLEKRDYADCHTHQQEMQTTNQCKPSATAHPYVCSIQKVIIHLKTDEPTTSERFHFLADERGWSRQYLNQRARLVSESCSYFMSCKPFPLYLQQAWCHRGGIASVVRTITQLDTAAGTPTLALPDNTL